MMATPTGIAPIKQAIVKALRAHSALKAAVSNEFHEAVVPRDVEYPFVVYDVAYLTHDYTWGSDIIRSGVDIHVISDDQVEAHNLDQLVTEAVQDVALDLGSSGQSTLYCRRRSDVSLAALDDSGKKIYQVGGSFLIWTDQPI